VRQNPSRKPVQKRKTTGGSEGSEGDGGIRSPKPAAKAATNQNKASAGKSFPLSQDQVDAKLFHFMQEIHSITQGSMESALKAANLAYEQEGKLDLARAINLYYEQGLDKQPGTGEQQQRRKDEQAGQQQQEVQRAATATGGCRGASIKPLATAARGDEAQRGATPDSRTTMGVLPMTKVPEWGLGQPPEGGPHYATFKIKLHQFERYRNQTANRTTVTFKSCILTELRPALEGKCGMPEHVWNEVLTAEEVQRATASAEQRGEKNLSKYLSGWTDEEVINKIKETLKPPRVEDYEIQFEGKKLKHTGALSELGGKFETWAADWLALEQEAKSQGVEIAPARMKKHFEQAVRWHPAIERIIKGTTFTSCKEWYGKISKELQVQASYASQLERDLKGGRGDRNSTPVQFPASQGGRGRGSGGSHVNHQSQESHHQSPYRRKFQDRGPEARPGGAAPAGRGENNSGARGNHVEGIWGNWAQGNAMEPMAWQPNQAGRGRGGRSRGRSEPPPGRGDRKGAAKGESFGTRQPINNPMHESPSCLMKGPYWHENGDLLRCSSALCGAPFDSTVFCQGCGWKGHSREWCYKSNEPGFNATGYWSINRKGQPPLPGKNGQFRGARGNLMDASAEGQDTTAGTNGKTSA
jgi:hypothetical protein